MEFSTIIGTRIATVLSALMTVAISFVAIVIIFLAANANPRLPLSKLYHVEPAGKCHIYLRRRLKNIYTS